ncbi:MAG: sarcosine oxidase subunit gamma family protein [Siculibacillus sp.]|nr:sarcosine oxidase subunit gamma family protein [Siculibacillus sp.]
MPDANDLPLRVEAFAGLPPLDHAPRFAARPLPPEARFVFRGREAAIEAATAAFGLALPRAATRAAEAAERAALWLGPDEWLLLAPEAEGEAVAAAFRTIVAPHSLVDVSHRNAGLDLVGTKVAEVLNAGCPLDLHLSAFPVGMCTRTLCAKAEIVLWRRAVDRFRLECGRSFAPYVHGVLADAAMDHSIEA